MSTVTSKDLAMLVNENWNSKAELSDVFRQGGDLLRRMSPGMRGLDRIASMAALSVLASFIRAKTRAASSDVRPSHFRVFFSLAPLGRPDSTLTSISSCPKTVDAVRRAHDGDSRLNRLRNAV